MSTGKKRFWSDDEKREICGQTFGSGISVAQVARRYAVNANLIHKWLRDPRFSKTEDGVDDVIDAVAFLPIELAGDRSATEGLSQMSPNHRDSPLCATRVDLTLSDGRRVLIEGPTAFGAVLGLVEGLML